jgi:F-type H+-transporting ATPase subunit epsilon
MPDVMQFELVSPERRLAAFPAREVLIPGTAGDMTAMPGHLAVITTLRPGILRVVTDRGAEEFVVSGGFAEITGSTVSVLAEQALPRAEMTAKIHARWVEEMRQGLTASSDIAHRPGPVDDAARLLADMVAVGDRMGFGAPPRPPAGG